MGCPPCSGFSMPFPAPSVILLPARIVRWRASTFLHSYKIRMKEDAVSKQIHHTRLACSKGSGGILDAQISDPEIAIFNIWDRGKVLL